MSRAAMTTNLLVALAALVLGFAMGRFGPSFVPASADDGGQHEATTSSRPDSFPELSPGFEADSIDVVDTAEKALEVARLALPGDATLDHAVVRRVNARDFYEGILGERRNWSHSQEVNGISDTSNVWIVAVKPIGGARSTDIQQFNLADDRILPAAWWTITDDGTLGTTFGLIREHDDLYEKIQALPDDNGLDLDGATE